MKRLSRITSLALSALMVMLSVITAYAVDTIGTIDTELMGDIGGMSNVEAPYPFEFVVVSTEGNEAAVMFVPELTSEYTFYLGVKGQRTEIEKTNKMQYIVEVGVEYSFVYTYAVNSRMTVYNGTLVVEADEDAGVTVTPTGVVKNTTYAGDITPAVIDTYSLTSITASGTIFEYEPNDVLTIATITEDDYDSYGAITSTTDVDWWTVTFDSSGTANFWLGNIPSGCNYDISLYNQYGVLLGSSYNLGQTAELIQCDVTSGTNYYIKIESISGTSSSQYLFRAKNYIPAVAPTIPSNAIGVHVVDSSGNPIQNARIFVYAEKHIGLQIDNDDMPIPEPVYTDSNGYAVISSITTINPYYTNVTYPHVISNSLSYGINVVTPTSGTKYAQYSFPDAIYPSTSMHEVVLSILSLF